MREQALRILKDVFGYDAFRGNQARIIERVAEGGDALVLMPTGGGKSLCFQVPALLREGLTVVVSPLIALMEDQVATLDELGVPAVALNSTLNPSSSGTSPSACSVARSSCSTWHRSGWSSRACWPSCNDCRSACSPSTKRTACRNGP